MRKAVVCIKTFKRKHKKLLTMVVLGRRTRGLGREMKYDLLFYLKFYSHTHIHRHTHVLGKKKS